MDTEMTSPKPVEFSSTMMNTAFLGLGALFVLVIHWGVAYAGVLSFRNMAMLYGWGAFTFFYFKIRGRRTKRSWNEMGNALGLTVERGWSFQNGFASFFRLKGMDNQEPVSITGRRMKSLEKWFFQIEKSTPYRVSISSRRGGPLLTRPIVLTQLPGHPILLGDEGNSAAVRLRCLDG